MEIEARLAELGLSLPEPPRPIGSYLLAQPSGDLLFLSGTTCYTDGGLLYQGPPGRGADRGAGLCRCPPDGAQPAERSQGNPWGSGPGGTRRQAERLCEQRAGFRPPARGHQRGFGPAGEQSLGTAAGTRAPPSG